MPRRTVGPCLVGAALGLYGAMSWALAQYPSGPALESQPIPGPGQGAGAEQGQNETAQHSADAGQIAAAIKEIMAATREMIPKEDSQNGKRQEQREIADLHAQQDMAVWAEAVFWATGTSVLVTFVGVLLVWRTLLYTKVAAIASRDAVTEAKNATTAAVATVDVTRDMGMKQLRAYINIEEATIRDFAVSDIPHMTIVFKNAGQTPAIDVRCKSAGCIDTSAAALRVVFKKPAHSRAPVISGGRSMISGDFGVTMNNDTIVAVLRGDMLVVVSCYIAYVDVLKRKRRTIARMALDVHSLRDGKGYFIPCRKGNRNT